MASALPKVRSRRGRRGRPARRDRQAAAQPDAGQLPARRARPYAAVAALAEMTEDEVLARVQRLLDERIIREVTPIFDTRALGYGSMLVAAKVDAEHPHRAAKIINSHPGVSHNYLRNHDFNLWFTIAVEPDSELGLQGTLDVLPAQTGAESIRQLPTLKLFKIRMDLEMEGGTEALAAAGEAVEPAELERQPYDERHRGRSAPRRAPAGRAPSPTRPPPSGSACPRTSCSSTCEGCRSAACCAASRRSSSTAAPASAPTAWASGRSPRTGSSRSARGWPPSAASPTATSARPTRTGRTRSSRWPTGAPRRSATRSSTRSPTATGHRGARHAVLLDRVQEDPAPLLHGRLQGLGSGARALSRPRSPTRARRSSTPRAARSCPAA